MNSYDMGWKEDYYRYGNHENVILSVRYYQDSYIQASSFTTGCSSTHEKSTYCFPTESSIDVHLNQICFYFRVAAILLVIVDVIVWYNKELMNRFCLSLVFVLHIPNRNTRVSLMVSIELIE